MLIEKVLPSIQENVFKKGKDVDGKRPSKGGVGFLRNNINPTFISEASSWVELVRPMYVKSGFI